MKLAGLVMMAALAAHLYAGSKKAEGRDPSEVADLTVYVAASGALDLQTKALAGRMLATAGVQVAWRTGEPKPCAAGGLAVGIELGEASARDGDRGVLARVYLFAVGIRRITVLVDRVHARASESGVDPYKLMAHVLVHEIGHVLERVDRHSDTGVMKARWTRDDYQAIAWKPLPFAEEDLESIQKTLQELRAQRPVTAGPSN